jgi:hypothetical protein
MHLVSRKSVEDGSEYDVELESVESSSLHGRRRKGGIFGLRWHRLSQWFWVLSTFVFAASTLVLYAGKFDEKTHTIRVNDTDRWLRSELGE